MISIDFRSDTVTLPTAEMKNAMMTAHLGDDVYGDDQSINALEDYVAKRLGLESALFTPSGTSANLVGIMAHCQRGDEYIVGGTAHTYKYEGGGAAVLGSIQPQPIEFESDGTIDLEKVEKKIKPDNFHFARTTLLCLENTQDGKVLPLEYLQEAYKLCQKYTLSLHLDGARICNAAVALGIELREITQYFNSVSLCLSKGLGAPVGSLFCGTKELVDKARRWRKVTGGGMRQAGFLAEAGLYALENHFDRLSIDHQNAQILATSLQEIPGCEIIEKPQTNMVFVRFDERFNELENYLASKNILISQDTYTRFVTHLGITTEDISTLQREILRFIEQSHT